MTPDLFEYATRNKLRFETPKGHLSVEQLWDLNLTHINPDVTTLDTVARSVNKALKEVAEESFVHIGKNTQEEKLFRKLEIVKRVIAVKLAEQEEAKQTRSKAQKKQEILELLKSKDQEALKGLSREQLEQMLAELG